MPKHPEIIYCYIGILPDHSKFCLREERSDRLVSLCKQSKSEEQRLDDFLKILVSRIQVIPSLFGVSGKDYIHVKGSIVYEDSTTILVDVSNGYFALA